MKTKLLRTILPAAALAILALPSAAAADRTITVDQGKHTFRVNLEGKVKPSDLKAIKQVDFRRSKVKRDGALASGNRLFCGRLLNPNQNCGNIPADFLSLAEIRAEYYGGGQERVCVVAANANHFYPNGDPRYAWVGACGYNTAVTYLGPATGGHYGDGWWVNSTVVNASPRRHTIWQRMIGPGSSPLVCGFEVQC